MKAKAFEIRDKSTFILAVAVQMVAGARLGMLAGVSEEAQTEAERYLLDRAGMPGMSPPPVLLKTPGASN